MPVARNHMSTELLTVEPDLPLTEVAKRMVAKDVGAVLVFDGGTMCGILTERDVLRAVADGIDEETTLVRERMTPHPETLDADDTTEHAAVLMIHGGFRHLPVMKQGEVVGVLSIRDLVRVVLEDSVRRGVYPAAPASASPSSITTVSDSRTWFGTRIRSVGVRSTVADASMLSMLPRMPSMRIVWPSPTAART